MKEHKTLKNLAKEVLPKDQLKKIKKIKSPDDKTEGLKYLLTSKLKLKLLKLELEIKKINKKEEPIIEAKLKLLNSKIKTFESTYSKKDYDNVQKAIQKIKSEVRHV